MTCTVIFTPEADDQLSDLYEYIETNSSPEIAARFTEGIAAYCESLNTFTHRGTQRDDIRPGIRITNYRKRVAIAFEVHASQVTILGIFCGGQNCQNAFEEE